MPGQVEIANPVSRHVLEKGARVVAMVDAVDDDIVDVEHQVAVGFFEDRQQKLFLTEGCVDGRIERDVLKGNTLLKNVLYTAYAFRYVG